MRAISFIIFLLLSLINCKAQKFDENNVELYYEYSAENGYDLLYEKDSIHPFTGQLISKSSADKVFIDIKNGKPEGNFISFNTNGDTLEYRKFEHGKELFWIYYKYENGKRTESIKTEKVSGDSQDYMIFDKALTMIRSKQFTELDQYLNPLWSSYERNFTDAEKLFGSLERFEVKEINKSYIKDQDAEHLFAKIQLNFKDTGFMVDFLIVEGKTRLTGQAFTFPSFRKDLKPDSLIMKIIHAVNERNLDTIMSINGLSPQSREALSKNLENVKWINDSPAFLDFHLGLLPKTQLIKDYIVMVGNEKQVMTLVYIMQENGDLKLQNFVLRPFRKPYTVIHKLF